MEYKVVYATGDCSNAITTLKKDVDWWLNNGWKAQGGITISSYNHTSASQSCMGLSVHPERIEIVAAQALVKED